MSAYVPDFTDLPNKSKMGRQSLPINFTTVPGQNLLSYKIFLFYLACFFTATAMDRPCLLYTSVSVVVNLAYFAFFNWLHFLHSFTPHHFSIFHFCKSPKGMTVSQSQPACFRFYSTQLFYHFANKKTILLNAEIKASFPEIHVNLHM